jgi:hypothetical protein
VVWLLRRDVCETEAMWLWKKRSSHLPDITDPSSDIPTCWYYLVYVAVLEVFLDELKPLLWRSDAFSMTCTCCWINFKVKVVVYCRPNASIFHTCSSESDLGKPLSRLDKHKPCTPRAGVVN